MAIVPRTLTVTVTDEQGSPLQNVALTLMMGGSQPQFKVSDQAGQASFANLPPGTYRLLTSKEQFNTRSTSVTMSGNNDETLPVQMRIVDDDSTSSRPFFRLLTLLQYLFLAVLGGIFAFILIKGINASEFNLSNDQSARGLITFVVAVVTVSIALILVMAAFLIGGKDVDKRLGFGKEVFTVLVGVLGTIMGFYYGQATKSTDNANTNRGQAAVIQISVPQAALTANLKGDFTLTGKISGGEKPYSYTVTFDNPEVTATPAENIESKDGVINQKFTVTSNPELAGKPIGFKIEAKDKNDQKGSFDKGTLTVSKQ